MKVGLVVVLGFIIAGCSEVRLPSPLPEAVAATEVTTEQAAIVRACESVGEDFTDFRFVEELPAEDGLRRYHLLAETLVGEKMRDVSVVVSVPLNAASLPKFTRLDCVSGGVD